MLSSVCAQSVVRAPAKECSFTYFKTLPGAEGHLVTFILQDVTYQLECSAKKLDVIFVAMVSKLLVLIFKGKVLIIGIAKKA